MKPTEQDIIRINDLFQRMRSKEDFLFLLNQAKLLVYGEKAYPFKLNQITWYSVPKKHVYEVGRFSFHKKYDQESHIRPRSNRSRLRRKLEEFDGRYLKFTIPKANGEKREINAPVKGLMAIQKCLNLIFQCVYHPHKNTYGFVQNRSIVDNARIHSGSNYVYNIDLKDFFSSIDQARIWKCLQLSPFNLYGKDRLQLANLIAVLCCTELEVERKDADGNWKQVKRNVLPQGAPTSPILTNVVCRRLDLLLTGVAKRFGLRYTRYADDITFSSMHNVYQDGSDFIRELHRIIEDQGFAVKTDKTRLQKQGYRQEVTGLIVNQNVNTAKKYVKELRMWLYYWVHSRF